MGTWGQNRLASEEANHHAEQIASLLFEFLVEEIGDFRKEAFRLALGHHNSSPFDPMKLQELRRKIAALLRPGDEGSLLHCPHRQPFFLSLLAEFSS